MASVSEMMPKTIAHLVAGLPEVYQPIFGHPQLSADASRPCGDRLADILAVCAALQAQLGRRLTVLDLGCAQGFFSLSLANEGARVHGVDRLDANIAVCAALAAENPQLEVDFAATTVEESIERLVPGQYDVVLGLSVFHHLVHESGAAAAKALLECAAENCGVLIVELALREEPLYWGDAQPDDPRTLLDGIAFVHEAARHATHLSPIVRPLYVASDRYWAFGRLAGRFDTWTADPHALAQGTHEASRRYFFGPETVAKTSRFDHSRGDHNQREFRREKAFLENPPPGFPAPVCLAVGENAAAGWVVTERLQGRLLLDLLREGAAIDRRRVLLSVLEQLAALEAAALYHNDVRCWNVLVADDGAARLIDFGSVSAEKGDVIAPGDPFLAFLVLARETVTGVVEDPDFPRIVSLDPHALPDPFREWALALWQQPRAGWTFASMFESLARDFTATAAPALLKRVAPWEDAVRDAMRVREVALNQLESRADQAAARADQAEARAGRAEAELAAMRASRSWRITAPLRWIADKLHK